MALLGAGHNAICAAERLRLQSTVHNYCTTSLITMHTTSWIAACTTGLSITVCT